jgi:hypothetical protein
LLTGVPSELSISASDGNDDTLTAELVSAPPGVTLAENPLRLRFNVLAAGAFPVAIKISDGKATLDVTLWLHVQAPGNYVPVFGTNVTWVTLPGGVAWSLPLNVTDKNQDPLTVSVTGAVGMEVAEGDLMWTPPHHGAGQVTATLRASDGVTATTHEIVIIVEDAPNTAPIMPVRGVTSTGQGGLLQLSVPATDAEGDTVSYAVSATMSPATPVSGFAVDANGLVTWRVPTAFNTANRVYATVQATDNFSPPGSTSKKYTVQVFPNNPPTITASGSNLAQRGADFSLTFAANDPDIGDIVFLEAVTLPTGMTLTKDPVNSNYLLEWHPIGVGGDIEVGIRAVDPRGALKYWTPGMVTVVNNAPSLSAHFPPGYACLGQTMQVDLVASDGDADPLTLSSNSIDVRFQSAPVTAGFLDFSDYMRPASNTILIKAADSFGGTAYASKQYQVFGWREVAEIPNKISTFSGRKVTPLLATQQVKGELIAAWQEIGQGQYDRIYVERIGQNGCPSWGRVLSIAEGQSEAKSLHAIGVNAQSVISTYSIEPEAGSVCDATGGFPHGLAITSTLLSDGEPIESLCIDKNTSPYLSRGTRLVGNPSAQSQLLTYGNQGETTLSLLFLKITSAGAVSSETYSRSYSNVLLEDFAVSNNASNQYLLGWVDSVDGTAKVVSLSPTNVEAFAPTIVGASASNVRGALFANNRSLIVYSQSRYIKFIGVNDNGSLSSIAGPDTLDDAGTGNVVGADGFLIPEIASGSVSFAYYVWSKQGSVFAQSLAYNSANNTATAYWNAGAAPIQVSTAGVNKNPRAAILDDKLMVTWEQEVGTQGQVIAMARVLDRVTGAPLGEPMVVSAQPTNAITSMVPLGGGIGVSFIDYSSDSLHGDIALSYLGIAGNSRP